MRVFNQHVKWAALAPLECQPPLSIDLHMPGAVVLFEIISGWGLHEVQRRGRVELRQLALRNLFDVGKTGLFTSLKQRLRVNARETLNGNIKS